MLILLFVFINLMITNTNECAKYEFGLTTRRIILNCFVSSVLNKKSKGNNSSFKQIIEYWEKERCVK